MLCGCMIKQPKTSKRNFEWSLKQKLQSKRLRKAVHKPANSIFSRIVYALCNSCNVYCNDTTTISLMMRRSWNCANDTETVQKREFQSVTCVNVSHHFGLTGGFMKTEYQKEPHGTTAVTCSGKLSLFAQSEHRHAVLSVKILNTVSGIIY